MAFYSFIFSALLLAFSAHSSDGLPSEEETQRLMSPSPYDSPELEEVHFSLTNSKNPAIVRTNKRAIEKAESPKLNELFIQAQKSHPQPVTITLGRVENIEVFKKMVRHLEGADLNIANCDELSALILYADRFSSRSLCDDLVVHLEAEKFILPQADVQSIEPVVRLTTTLSTLIQKKSRDGIDINDWTLRITNWLVRHILTNAYLDKQYRRVYDRLRTAFGNDQIGSALLPDATTIAVCKAAAEQKRALIKQAEADEIARELHDEIRDRYVRQFLDKDEKAIYVRVNATLANEIAQSLRVMTHDDFEVGVYPAEDVPQDMCCFGSFANYSDTNGGQNCEAMAAYIISTIVNWIGPQIAQCITSGWCFRGCRDCQGGVQLGELCRAALADGRTGQAIYTCVYDSLTAMGNCCRGKGCQPTKTIKLTRKPVSIRLENNERKRD